MRSHLDLGQLESKKLGSLGPLKEGQNSHRDEFCWSHSGSEEAYSLRQAVGLVSSSELSCLS